MPHRFVAAALSLLLTLAVSAGPSHAKHIATSSGVAMAADSVTADSLRPGEASMVVSAPALPARDYIAEARAGYTPVNRRYQDTRVALLLLGPWYGIAVTLLLLFTGWSARFRDVALALGRRPYTRALVYFTLFAAASTLLGLPLAWYEEFSLEHRYGLSTQTLAGWFADTGKGLLFTIVSMGVVPLVFLAWRAIQKHPRGWWWRLAAFTSPIALAAVMLQPLVFEPLFNKFEPLRDASLRGEILALGARAGIPSKHVVQVDMSRRTLKVNAYVSGFGASQRIVLWDTTLRALRRDEILVVMGHEMGHYVLGHMWKAIGVIAVGAFAAFWLAAWLVNAMLAAFGGRWRTEGPGDLAALPALSVALALVTLVAQPGLNAFSRAIEHESDVYALEITHDNDAAARAFLKLAADNRSNPEPRGWVEFLLYDHPPLGDRIRFALAYRPWEKGEPNRFFHGR